MTPKNDLSLEEVLCNLKNCQETVHQRESELNLFKDISRAIISNRNLQEILVLTANKARELIGAELLIVPMINEDNKSYTYSAASGKNAEDIVGSEFAMHVGMCGWVLTNEKPLRFSRDDPWESECKTTWEDNVNSALLVPIIGDSGIIGGLSGIKSSHSDGFSQRDQDLLELFANQISIAIENARLFKELEHNNRVLDEKNREIRLFYDTTMAISEAPDTDGALEEGVKKICEYTGWKIGSFYYYNEEKDILLSGKRWYSSSPALFLERLQTFSLCFHRGYDLPGRVLATGKTVYVRDLVTDKCFLRSTYLEGSNIGIGIALPIYITGKLYCVLEFFTSEDTSEFDDKIENTINYVCEQIGQSIERKIVQNAILDAKDKAEEANNSKSRFLATMSHELRTPLNGVLGMSQLLLLTEMSEKQKLYTDTINKSGATLLNLVNDILEFSMLDSGETKILLVALNLHTCIKEVLNNLQEITSDNNVDLIFDSNTQALGAFMLDPICIRKIVYNLVNNAVKFSKGGRVIVRVFETGEYRDDQARIRFEIEDSGIGIPQNKLEMIFESFTQIDASTTRQFGGIGLGLAICKKEVDLMEGTIGVESEVNNGSLFWFEVPTKKVHLEDGKL